MGKLHDAMQMSVSSMLHTQGWSSVMEVPLPHLRRCRCDVLAFNVETMHAVGVEVKGCFETHMDRYKGRIERYGIPVLIAALMPDALRYASDCPKHWGIIGMEPTSRSKLLFRKHWVREPVLQPLSPQKMLEMLAFGLGRIGERQVVRTQRKLADHREAVMSLAWEKM